jgi:hypothetical protein
MAADLRPAGVVGIKDTPAIGPLLSVVVARGFPGDDGMATKAQGEIVTSKGRTLTHLATEVPVHVGDEVRSASGEKVLVTGGRAPRNENHMGRVRIKNGTLGQVEYAPHVFGLKWSE